MEEILESSSNINNSLTFPFSFFVGKVTSLLFIFFYFYFILFFNL